MASITESQDHLLGTWEAFMNLGEPFPENTLTVEFTEDGKLITRVRDGGETLVLHGRYGISGNNLTVEKPEEFGVANHEVCRFSFDEKGHLRIEDSGGGDVSWYRRI